MNLPRLESGDPVALRTALRMIVDFARIGGLEIAAPAERLEIVAGLAGTCESLLSANVQLEAFRDSMVALAPMQGGDPAAPWSDEMLATLLSSVLAVARNARDGGLAAMAPAARSALVGKLCTAMECLIEDHVRLSVRLGQVDELMQRCAVAEAELAALKGPAAPAAPAAPARPIFTVITGGADGPAGS